MNLHEYQAKQLFGEFGLPVPRGVVVTTAEQAVEVAKTFGTTVVAKVQVHAGGRGKVGGVKVLSDMGELKDFVSSMIGQRLVTIQTDAEGQPIHQVLIEEPCDIDRELYLSAVVDRATQRVVFMASQEGGVEIEEVAEHSPEKIFRVSIDPMIGVMPFQGRDMAFKLGLKGQAIKQFVAMLANIYRVFVATDLSQAEINPLVVTKEGDLLCLDAKVNIDDNALYRQAACRDMRDTSQEDEKEVKAQQHELNYISLDGNIGCMVNGAGLAMATMDLIKLHGGKPANFLDVGGGATKERVTEAFKLILSDSKVKGVLVNIFGGIVRCDLIAEGILAAVNEIDVAVPIVVRLEGNNADLGIKLLNESTLEIMAAQDFTEAAKQVVKAVSGESA